jgi:hypothetical protein
MKWGKWRNVLVGKYHAGAAVVGAGMAAVPAFAYDLSDFGLDSLITGVIALALLGYAAVSAAVSLGVGAESIFGIMIRWTKKAFGGR